MSVDKEKILGLVRRIRQFGGGGDTSLPSSFVPIKYAEKEYDNVQEAGAAGQDFNTTWLQNREGILKKNAAEAGWTKPEKAFKAEKVNTSVPVFGYDYDPSVGVLGNVNWLGTSLSPSYGNMKMPGTVELGKKNGSYSGSASVHEFAHALGLDKPQERVIESRGIQPVSGERNDYLDSATEVYSRLQQLRNDAKLDPYKVYNAEDIQEMRNNTALDQQNLLNRYSDDDILFLLNDVAQNPLDKDYTNYAARGGQLKNCFEPGGSIPTLEEYYAKQADSVRNAALQRSRTRTLPRSIPDGFVDLQGEEDLLRGLAAEHAATVVPQYDSFVSPVGYRFDAEHTRLGRYLNTLGNMEQYRSASYNNLPFTPVDEYLRLAAEGRMDNIDNAYASQRYTEDADSVAVRRVRGDVIPKFAPNCIATATDNYGAGHYVQSNNMLLADPYKYGFEQIPVSSAKPGDLVQVLRDDGSPFHAMIFNGLDDNGLATFNYSNGEEGEGAYHKNWHWYDTPFVDGAFNAFRFVGTDADKDAWQKEYESQFAGGGKIHIDPSKKGTFTAAAKKHGKSVQGFASQVLAHKENYSPAMVKKANFARNAAKWHAAGGLIQRFGAEKILQALQKMK